VVLVVSSWDTFIGGDDESRTLLKHRINTIIFIESTFSPRIQNDMSKTLVSCCIC